MRATPGIQGSTRSVAGSPTAWYSARGPQRGRPVPQIDGPAKPAPSVSVLEALQRDELALGRAVQVGELHQQRVHALRGE